MLFTKLTWNLTNSTCIPNLKPYQCIINPHKTTIRTKLKRLYFHSFPNLSSELKQNQLLTLLARNIQITVKRLIALYKIFEIKYGNRAKLDRTRKL